MAQRHLNVTLVSAVAIVLLQTLSTNAAPAFRFKKIFSPYEEDKFSSRSERRLVGGPSPVHFITPFVGIQPPPQSGGSFGQFFMPPLPMGNPSSSSIYKLPLTLLSNGKPHAVFHGIPKPQNTINSYLPHQVSKMVRLPLKYMSNAKPIGVYLKVPSYNYV